MSTQYDTDNYEFEKRIGVRRPNGAKNLKRLKPWHRQAIAAHLAGVPSHLAGVPSQVIAARFRKRPSTISIILNDPLAQAEIDRARAMHEAEFEALYGDMVNVLRRNLQGKDDRNALKAAQLFIKEKERLQGLGKGQRSAEDVIAEILGRITLQQNVQVNVQQGDH